MVPTIFSLAKEGMRPGQMTITNDDKKKKISIALIYQVTSCFTSIHCKIHPQKFFTSFNTLFIHQIVTLILVKTVERVQKYLVQKPTNATVRMHSQAKTVQNQHPSRRVRTHPVSIVNFIFSLHFFHCQDIPRTKPVIPYDAITMIKCRVFPTKLRKANKMSIMCSF